jgi:hypothetical protein
MIYLKFHWVQLLNIFPMGFKIFHLFENKTGEV